MRERVPKVEKVFDRDTCISIENGGDGFMIYTDISKDGLGCVLMQNEQVIVYASHKLKILMSRIIYPMIWS